MRHPTSETGSRAEQAGQCFLEERGLILVARNFRCRSGEIDLVMTDGPCLVFVEIRYRASPDPVDPVLTVTAAKRRRIARAAARFLQTHTAFRDSAARFDVLGLTGPLPGARCEWYRGAFTTDDMAGFQA